MPPVFATWRWVVTFPLGTGERTQNFPFRVASGAIAELPKCRAAGNLNSQTLIFQGLVLFECREIEAIPDTGQ